MRCVRWRMRSTPTWRRSSTLRVMNTLDNSMLAYLNKNCPGWMCVPHTPHPFENERHTISDRDLVGGNPILWHTELQEGKDRPSEIVTMDSGFSILKGIVEMEREIGVYGQALIKKRGRYWSKGVPGDFIDVHLKDNPISHSKTLELVFDCHPFFSPLQGGEICDKDDFDPRRFGRGCGPRGVPEDLSRGGPPLEVRGAELSSQPCQTLD
ncbi:hypothetical protein ACHAWF_008896 [Thalassiosira exigua]